MDFKLGTCRMVIVALAVIYNISLDLGEKPEEPEQPVVAEGDNDESVEPEVIVGEEAIRAAGEAMRDSLLRSF